MFDHCKRTNLFYNPGICLHIAEKICVKLGNQMHIGREYP
uniref:Uncharacterized protein n=1 Tax=Rhizophora mucronata TaxID=61149 RepID=A0A2P2PX81_RHIMU